MKVKYKIAITVVPIFLSAIILLNISYGLFFANYVKKQESSQVDILIKSLSTFMLERQNGYIGAVNDWAHWDETYDFVKTGYEEYIFMNLTESTFINLDLSFMIFMDNNESVTYSRFYSPDSSFTDFPTGFFNEFQSASGYIQGSDDSFGIIKLGAEYYFIASSDITDSILEKPPVGKWIIGRQISADIIETMGNITGCTINGMSRAGDFGISQLPEENTGAILYQSEINSSHNTLSLRILIPNTYDNNASLMIDMAMPRDLFTTQMREVWIFSVINASAFTLISIFMIILLGKYLSKPFRELISELKLIDITKNSIPKLCDSGNDEFSFMRKSINNLLNEIETYHTQLVESKEELRATLVSVGDGVISVDNQARITFMNPIALSLTGWTLEDALGKPIEEVFNIIHEYTRDPIISPVYTVFEKDEIVELANHTLLLSKDGSETPIEDTAAPIKDISGITRGCVLVFRDFSERKEKQRWIEYLSYHDQLTGLYNRRFFEEELKRLNIEDTLPLSFIYADVNGLKIINDVFGHESGDKIIMLSAELFTSECGPNEIVARIGGDEFVILLPKTEKTKVESLVERMMAKANTMKYQDIELSISFGFDTKDESQQSVLEVLKKAEELMYQKKILNNTSKRNGYIKSILNTLHIKCPREEAHSKRVREICESIGNAYQLNIDEINELRTAAELHDIGKIAIDETILNKEGKLSESEWDQIKHHPDTGYRLLSATSEFSNLAEYVLSHHERWDGKGYPRGLVGDEINWKARVIAVADAYDAMTSDRPYRKALSLKAAAEEIRLGAGIQFDPDIAKVFIEKVLQLEW